MHATGLRVDLLGQLLGVGRAQLREAAVLQDDARQRIALGQLLEHVLGGGGLPGACFLAHGQALLVEQDFLQLLGRIEVEGLAGRLVRLDFELGEALCDFAALLFQQPAVHEHAVVLHLEQHRHERLLDLLVDREQGRVLFERGMEDAVQLQRDVRVFGRVLGGPLDRHLVEGDLLRALAGDVLVLDRVDAEVELRAGIHVVARRGRVQHVGLEHRVVAHAGEFDAAALQHVCVVLQVMADLPALRVLEQRLQPRERRRPVELVRRAGVVVRERQVGGLAGLDAERDADDLGFHVVEAGGLGVEGEEVGGLRAHRSSDQAAAPSKWSRTGAPVRAGGTSVRSRRN